MIKHVGGMGAEFLVHTLNDLHIFDQGEVMCLRSQGRRPSCDPYLPVSTWWLCPLKLTSLVRFLRSSRGISLSECLLQHKSEMPP